MESAPIFILKLYTLTKFLKFTNKPPTNQHYPISCQSGANVVLTRESPDGTYLTYFPFGAIIKVAK